MNQFQVGASDFRESLHIPGSTTVSISSGDSFISDQSMEDKRNAIANAECIALKCEEKGCQFITAWDSEMQRHLAECHAPITSNKSRKPLPMLIPLSPAKLNNMNSGGPSTTLLKVPRVRVRPELAQIARDTELAKLYGSKEVSYFFFFLSNVCAYLTVNIFMINFNDSINLNVLGQQLKEGCE